MTPILDRLPVCPVWQHATEATITPPSIGQVDKPRESRLTRPCIAPTGRLDHKRELLEPGKARTGVSIIPGPAHNSTRPKGVKPLVNPELTGLTGSQPLTRAGKP